VLIGLQAPGGGYEENLYSSSMACPECGINVPKLEPRSFSFNSSYGACPECHGLGSIYDFDPAKTITDWSKPLLDGAMGPGSASQYLLRMIKLAAEKYGIKLQQPFADLTKAQQDLLLYGPPREEIGRTGFHGVIPWLRDTLEDTKSEGYREYMMQYMSATECPRCHGKRLRPESLAVTIPLADAAAHPPSTKDETEPIEASNARRDASIADFTALSLERALLGARSMQFSGRERLIADRLQREIIERLEFLNAVGLGYLSLDRSAATISGGEGPAHTAGDADRLAAARRAVCAG
jgi:excinuclease ABC subunit A